MSNNAKRKKKKSKFRGFIRFLLIIIVLLGIMGFSLYGYIDGKFGEMIHSELPENELGIKSSVANDLSDYINIAILGVDTRDMNNMKDCRTDSIIIASFNKKTGKMKLISIFRDSYLNIKDFGNDKVTHAFAYGGAARTLNTLNRNLDLNIHDYVAMNFETVATLVDAVGGIEIDIKDDEINDMNRYIPDTANNIGKDSYDLIESTGKQKLDGVQAVTYSRIRKTSGGDYRRGSRMRDVVKAVLKSAKKMDIGDLNAAIDKVAPLMSTNMKTKDVTPVLLKLPTLKVDSGIGWPYDKIGWIGAAWYCVPVTLESNVTKLHEEAFDQKKYVPTKEVKDISESILNETGCYYPEMD